MPEELDRDLQALFQDHTRDLNDEPFVGSTLARIESQRARMTLGRLLLQAVGFIGLGLVSPLLIEGSVWLSSGLNGLFALAGKLLGTPLGAFIAVLGSIPFFVVRRKRRMAGMNGPFSIRGVIFR